ncbi:hypothetical protein WR25_07715 [Diploscapter pachys]|uniref:Uncharacterized protein n=1 Tax=Diploscapter pachys TaxID=2018661 RepID=A0A2A2L1H8_9BILA|nr:hypothetical protein WR25_07715 [Diploscapter pachys]
MQQVGTSTEECSGSAQCYNMSTTTGILVNVVKAGCSQWRCMLAKDTCIFTTFQYVPVSLCCCSWDRCNVAGNPVYSDNPNQMGGGGSNWGGNQGGGSNWGGNQGQGGFGGNQGGSSWNQNQGGGNMGQGQGQGGQNSGSNWGSSWGQATSAPNNNGWGTNTGSGSSGSNSGGGDEPQMQKQQAKFDQSAPSKSGGKKWTKEELEKIFAKQIDDKADEIQLEGDFKKVDSKYKASRPKV